MFSFKMLLSGLLAHAHAFARETLIIDSTAINASSSPSSPSLVVEFPCVSGAFLLATPVHRPLTSSAAKGFWDDRERHL